MISVEVRVRVRLRIRLRDRVISDATNNTTSRSRDQFSSTRGTSPHLAEHYIGLVSKGRRFDSHRGQAYFSSLPGVDIHSE